MEQLIGKALVDEKFREEFFRDTEGMIRGAGLDITTEELATIKKLNPVKAKQFAQVFAKEFGERKQGM